jgi:hypothetical protein
LSATVKTLLRLRQAERSLAERARQFALEADVVLALNRGDSLRTTLQNFAEAVVRHLDVAFARVWVHNEAEDVLELQATAGMYTHTDGRPGRVRVGESNIGAIAQSRRPLMSNALPDDPVLSDFEWARREGMVAFAGFPLVVEDHLLGVLAVFARRPLGEDTRAALAAVAEALASGIARKRANQERDQSSAREQAARAEAEAAGVAVRAHADRVEHLKRELQALERLAGLPAAAVTARAYGTYLLRESHPDVFRELTQSFGQLLDLALEQRAYKVASTVSEKIRVLSDRLGFLQAGPRDVLDVYGTCLKGKTAGIPASKAHVYVEEGRLLVLELMGQLVLHYRAAGGPRRSESTGPGNT